MVPLRKVSLRVHHHPQIKHVLIHYVSREGRGTARTSAEDIEQIRKGEIAMQRADSLKGSIEFECVACLVFLVRGVG